MRDPLRWMRARQGRDGDRRSRARAWALQRRVDVLEGEGRDLRRILAALGEGVLAVDNAGIVLHANPVALQLLGLNSTDSLGSHLYVAVPHPVLCDALEEVMRGVEQRDVRVTREFTVPHADGERAVVAHVTALRGSGDRATAHIAADGAVAIVRDVTELRRLEGARHDFFGNVSHELKTPITAIRGSLETIIDDPDMPASVRVRFLDGAVRHAARLNALVTDLLALARVEGDPRALHRAPLDLATLVGEVAEAAEAAAGQRGVQLSIEVARDGDAARAFVVEADEEAMRQAVSNLVANAIAYSDTGAVVEITLRTRGVFVEVAVTDTGSGIPADSIERIFERFYRVDTARSRELGGTGIGLSIVKHVAHAHGGSIEVTSELGAGSTFVLRIPVSRAGDLGTSHR
ncbi:MAG: signal transduction histidine kinase [Thermoleophilia bacterium]|nr:signal transduction histidine kinase [Thermoleophilia bacterium]